MKKYKIGKLTFLTFCILLMGNTCSQEINSRKTTSEEWQEIKANAKFIVSPEFGAPENLGSPINTVGWEDSPNIAPDGKTLLFAYVNWDLLASDMKGKYIISGPTRGFEGYNADCFISVKDNSGNCQEPKMLEFCTQKGSEIGPQLSYNGQRIYFSGFSGDSPGMDDIWFSDFANGLWQPKVNLGQPPNSEFQEDDPAISQNEAELFFSSYDRMGKKEKEDIWTTKKVNGVWQEPYKLGSPINTPSADMQPFLTWDGNYLYFSSDRNGVLSIYRSQKDEFGAWQEPGLVIEPDIQSGVIAVGEPTLTSDGQYLYFAAIYGSPYNEYDADILYVKIMK